MRLCFFVRLPIESSTKLDTVSNEVMLQAWSDMLPPIDILPNEIREQHAIILAAQRSTTIDTMDDGDNPAIKYIIEKGYGVHPSDITPIEIETLFKYYLNLVVDLFGYNHIDFKPDYTPFIEKIITTILTTIPKTVRHDNTVVIDNRRTIRFAKRPFVHDNKYYFLVLYCNDRETLPTHDELTLIKHVLKTENNIEAIPTSQNVKESWEMLKGYFM
jgi:hypothetical protein